jgi:DNA polymerase-3 subunit epsilon
MNQPDFVVIDVETANRGRHSICQIGVVGYRDGAELFAEETLVDPRDDFEPFNIAFHGISPAKVAGAPCFGDLHDWVHGLLADRIVVAHSSFDRSALRAACDRHGRAEIGCRWLDSIAVARRAWPDLPSYRLNNLARLHGIRFRHHDALEDARTAGLLVVTAMQEGGGTIEDWLNHRPAPVRTAASRAFDREPSPRRSAVCDGPLAGHVVAMTGTLSMPKDRVADAIQAAGGAVSVTVTKKTTLLVVGSHDAWGLPPGHRSGKQAKAEAAAALGQPIRVIDEAQLRAMMLAAAAA